MEILKSVPIIAQAKSFSELARNVTRVDNPIKASFSAVKLIADVCAPPQVKYPLKCTILLLQLGVCFASVTSIAIGIGTTKQILEELR